MKEKTSPTVLKISKIISNFFNPMTSLFIYFLFRNLQLHSLSDTVFLFFRQFFLAVTPITIWIVWNVKKGKYTNMDVSNRNQRKSLYFFIAGILVTYLLYDFILNENIDLPVTFILVLLLVMQISNYFIKSSMHTAFNIFVATLFFVIIPAAGIIWFGISIIVGMTRIMLKRHTPKEVFSGAVIALLVSFIYLYTNIQIQN